MPTRVLCHVAALLLAGAASAADRPPAGGIPDLTGPRTLALSSGVGIANGNDGLFVNVASIAARRRYSIDALLLVDRRGADTVGQWYGSSVVDAISSPVTAAFAYARAQKGEYTGNEWHLALAGPVFDKLYLGVAGKYLALKGPRTTSAATVDAGLFWQVADYLSLGASGYNLMPIGNVAVGPRGVGAGIAVGSDQSFQLTADWRADLDRLDATKNRFGIGAEVLLGHLVPLRGGWLHDEVLDTDWWSLGAGIVARSGVALDIGYRQSVKDPAVRTIAASIRMFLFD